MYEPLAAVSTITDIVYVFPITVVIVSIALLLSLLVFLSFPPLIDQPVPKLHTLVSLKVLFVTNSLPLTSVASVSERVASLISPGNHPLLYEVDTSAISPLEGFSILRPINPNPPTDDDIVAPATMSP